LLFDLAELDDRPSGLFSRNPDALFVLVDRLLKARRSLLFDLANALA
jgi:hypothetical protein